MPSFEQTGRKTKASPLGVRAMLLFFGGRNSPSGKPAPEMEGESGEENERHGGPMRIPEGKQHEEEQK